MLLLFAFWIFRPGYRSAKAGTKSRAAAASASTAALHAANRDPEDDYLKDRFYSNKPTPEGLNLAVDFFSQAMVHDPHAADACVVVRVRGHLRVWKLPVYNQVMTTVSKHQADSRLIMVFARFIGFLRRRL